MSKTQARPTQFLAEIQTLCNTGPHGYLDVGFTVCWNDMAGNVGVRFTILLLFYHVCAVLHFLSLSFFFSLFYALILQERSKFPSQSQAEQFIKNIETGRTSKLVRETNVEKTSNNSDFVFVEF